MTDWNEELWQAADDGNSARVQEALDAGADPNFQGGNHYGDTVLMLAAYNGHTDVVRELLTAGAGIDIQNQYGDTALMLAAGNGHTDVVRELLTARAGIDAQNRYGNTALIEAARNGHTDVVRELLAAGAGIDVQDTDGNTALMLAAGNGHTEIIQLIKDVLPGLPALDTAEGVAALFIPETEGNARGFAPVDNPYLWEDKTIEDFKAIPLTRENLEARTPKNSGLFDSAFAGLPAKELLEYLNGKGVQLWAKDLLDAEGKPTKTLDRLIDDGKAPALFTLGNWFGAPSGDMTRAYEALPDAQREQVDYQTLKLSLANTATLRARER